MLHSAHRYSLTVAAEYIPPVYATNAECTPGLSVAMLSLISGFTSSFCVAIVFHLIYFCTLFCLFYSCCFWFSVVAKHTTSTTLFLPLLLGRVHGSASSLPLTILLHVFYFCTLFLFFFFYSCCSYLGVAVKHTPAQPCLCLCSLVIGSALPSSLTILRLIYFCTPFCFFHSCCFYLSVAAEKHTSTTLFLPQ